ncbi:MAG: flavodoxin domain-containing protein [Candidatus Riflebacteria bacterium]|nr:flavodoxin domain-containing protein [Candidatus Riflebacteria bacterium]
MVQELTKGVYWVGVVDWGLRHFHGHELSTPRGSSYNAYLIMDERITLVDTVWGPFQDQLLDNIRQIVDPSRIDVIVANHAEPDHSGSLPAMLRAAPNAKVVVSKAGADSVPGHYHQKWNLTVVKTGDRINIGHSDLLFIEAPMLHWPDSMFCYLTGKNVLMPNDAFGQHYATSSRFNDQVDQQELFWEALKYYANILAPFSHQVTRKIEEFVALNLPVDIIAPSHGVIWRSNPLQIVTRYKEWAAQVPERSAVIIYDTMWQATRRMADAIADGLADRGVPYKIFYTALADRNEVIAEAFRARAIVVGSPTHNRGVLPSMMPFLEELKGLQLKNKIGAAFGSYGWSGESVKELEELLGRCKVQVAARGVKVKWQPGPEALETCRKLGLELADKIKAD